MALVKVFKGTYVNPEEVAGVTYVDAHPTDYCAYVSIVLRNGTEYKKQIYIDNTQNLPDDAACNEAARALAMRVANKLGWEYKP